MCAFNETLRFSNCPLRISKLQQVTEVPRCPLMNPNERRFKHTDCFHACQSVLQQECSSSHPLSISDTGVQLEAIMSAMLLLFPQGAGPSWRTASPRHFSFTWHYSVAEAISCSPDPWMSFPPCHLTSWLQNLISRQQSILAGVCRHPMRSCCGDNMQRQTVYFWKYALLWFAC